MELGHYEMQAHTKSKRSAEFHAHTEFSTMSCGFKDSMNKTTDLMDRAYELGLAGIAITDHESITGHVRAIQHYKKKYKEEDFKLILGNEIYLGRPDLTSETHEKGERFHHIVLFAKDAIGHRQLRMLSYRAWDRAYFRAIQRRYNISSDFMDVIGNNRGHIIATTACLGGVTGNFFLNYEPEEALPMISSFLERMEFVFGKGNFYIELAPNDEGDQVDYNKFMYKNFYGKYPFLINADAHYQKKSDFNIFKSFLHSDDGKDREVDEFYRTAYLMDWEEKISYLDYLPSDFLEECRLNSLEIVEQIEDYDLKKNPVIPKVNLQEEYKKYYSDSIKTELISSKFFSKFLFSEDIADQTLAYRINDGISRENVKLTKKVIDRIDLELSEVWGISEHLNQKMSNYLVTMAKIIDIIWEDADALLGPSRGSAGAFIINFLIGITQWNPLEYELEIPHWRFISAERPDLPDIDIDTAGNKRQDVLYAIAKYFKSIGGDSIQVANYGTEKSKSAIKTAARGLGIDIDVANYISSLVPVDRGDVRSLHDCYYGTEEEKPISKFVESMNLYPELWRVAQKIEGLVTRMGIHAAGIIVTNEQITESASIMRTPKGIKITCFDLHDSEYCGLVKYDALSVDAIGKVRTGINYLLQHNVIKWKGNLRKTYNYYFRPDKIKYSSQLWNNIANHSITSLFQFSTPVGLQALSTVPIGSLTEAGIVNNLMRLMPQNKGDEMPVETYARYKNDITLWYDEMYSYGLNTKEIKIMEKHLLSLCGVMDSQESMMMVSMDPEISGFNVVKANKLRKGVAKKSEEAKAEAKKLFFEGGLERGTSHALLNYVWEVQITRLLGYAFSLPHTAAYSMIAMIEAYMYTNFPSVYWNASCLSSDSGTSPDDQFMDLIQKGWMKPSAVETDGKLKRGKVASAIGTYQKTMKIAPPNINASGYGFTPDESSNSISCGLKIINRLGDKIIDAIIKNRPYKNLNDFVSRMVEDNKKLISKDRVALLIKAGLFDELEGKSRTKILKDYVMSVSDTKKDLNLRNMQALINHNLLPVELDVNKRFFMWVKYIRKNRNESKTAYILDPAALEFYENNPEVLDQMKLENRNGHIEVSSGYVDRVYNKMMDPVRSYIKQNKKELLDRLNHKMFMIEWNKYKMDNIPQGEMQSMRIYVNEHESQFIDFGQYEITHLPYINEEEIVGHFYIDGKSIPKYQMYHIAGTVIDKDKNKHLVTLLTEYGPIDIKVWKQTFTMYDKKVTEVVDGSKHLIQDSFFANGTILMVTGMMRGGTFIAKKYKSTKVPGVILKVEKGENNEAIFHEKIL